MTTEQQKTRAERITENLQVRLKDMQEDLEFERRRGICNYIDDEGNMPFYGLSLDFRDIDSEKPTLVYLLSFGGLSDQFEFTADGGVLYRFCDWFDSTILELSGYRKALVVEFMTELLGETPIERIATLRAC